jgi:hypothetical protein
VGYSRVSDPPTVGSSTICVCWSGSRAYYGSAGRNRKTRKTEAMVEDPVYRVEAAHVD